MDSAHASTRQLSAVAWCLQALLWPAAGLAQADSVAESLFREARAQMSRGNYDAACPKFAESFRIQSALGTLLNLALCEEQRGRIATA